jgi:hypothetical protein
MAHDEDVIVVRIPPKSPRATHVIANMVLRKDKGWYELDAGLRSLLEKEPLHDSNPHGEKVFQVCTPAEAAAIHMAETAREDPRGTPDKPARPVMAAGTAPAAAPPAGDALRVPGGPRRTRAPGTVPLG